MCVLWTNSKVHEKSWNLVQCLFLLIDDLGKSALFLTYSDVKDSIWEVTSYLYRIFSHSMLTFMSWIKSCPFYYCYGNFLEVQRELHDISPLFLCPCCCLTSNYFREDCHFWPTAERGQCFLSLLMPYTLCVCIAHFIKSCFGFFQSVILASEWILSNKRTDSSLYNIWFTGFSW